MRTLVGRTLSDERAVVDGLPCGRNRHADHVVISRRISLAIRAPWRVTAIVGADFLCAIALAKALSATRRPDTPAGTSDGCLRSTQQQTCPASTARSCARKMIKNKPLPRAPREGLLWKSRDWGALTGRAKHDPASRPTPKWGIDGAPATMHIPQHARLSVSRRRFDHLSAQADKVLRPLWQRRAQEF